MEKAIHRARRILAVGRVDRNALAGTRDAPDQVTIHARADAETEDARALSFLLERGDELRRFADDLAFVSDVTVGHEKDVAMSPAFDLGGERGVDGVRHFGSAAGFHA